MQPKRALTTSSRSGLKVTSTMGVQLRVTPDQRRGWADEWAVRRYASIAAIPIKNIGYCPRRRSACYPQGPGAALQWDAWTLTNCRSPAWSPMRHAPTTIFSLPCCPSPERRRLRPIWRRR